MQSVAGPSIFALLLRPRCLTIQNENTYHQLYKSNIVTDSPGENGMIHCLGTHIHRKPVHTSLTIQTISCSFPSILCFWNPLHTRNGNLIIFVGREEITRGKHENCGSQLKTTNYWHQLERYHMCTYTGTWRWSPGNTLCASILYTAHANRDI